MRDINLADLILLDFYYRKLKNLAKIQIICLFIMNFCPATSLCPAFSSRRSSELPAINIHIFYFPRLEDHVLRPDRLAHDILIYYVYVNLYVVLCIASQYSE